jgi:two-component system, NtrC family, sensor histidine kinase HydH
MACDGRSAENCGVGVLNMPDKPSLTSWIVPLYVVLCAPLVMLPALCIWKAFDEGRAVRLSSLRTETSLLRAQAQRRAGHLEAALDREGAILDWRILTEDPWVQRYWQGIRPAGEGHLYAAIVDGSGTIRLHSDAALVGQELGQNWYDRVVLEAGTDVVQVSDSVLSNGRPAFDVSVGLDVGGRRIGNYHEGLDRAALESRIAAQERGVWQKWAWIIAAAAALDAGAAFALLVLLRRYRDLLRQCLTAAQERTTQLGVIAAGLAHEIRNPLQTMRINLHALRRGLTGRAQLSPEDQMSAIEESNVAVDTLEELMRDLLRFAAPEPGTQTDLNLVAEVQATLNLLNEEMRGKQIEVSAKFQKPAVQVSMSSGRLRQLLLNLLTFAEHNAGPSGRIDVSIAARDGAAELVVADSGPTLSPTERARVFEPFCAARKTRSGLGLALVKAFASEAGGMVDCLPHQPTGNRFRVLLPMSRSL